MIISTSGYYSTGSSAVYALLEEYDSCTKGQLENWHIKGIDYEQIFLYTPDGLFDLEDKLLLGNSIHRSDEAMRRFKDKMEKLYKNNFLWMGGFQEMLGTDFMLSIDEFLNSICQYRVPGHWEYHYGNNSFHLRKFIGSIKRTLLGRKVIGDFSKMCTYELDPIVYYSFISEEVFYANARKLLNQFLFMMKGNHQQENLILNHFLLPHTFYRIPNYFGDDFRVIVVDRDPRDVFVMEKYRTRSDHSLLPCDDVREFVEFWKSLRESEKKIDDDRIIRIQFEDLIYRYDDTIKQIENACGLNSECHRRKGEIFNPQKSIYNTQLFTLDNIWGNEIAYIEQHLSEYLYPFPEGVRFSETITRDKFGVCY